MGEGLIPGNGLVNPGVTRPLSLAVPWRQVEPVLTPEELTIDDGRRCTEHPNFGRIFGRRNQQLLYRRIVTRPVERRFKNRRSSGSRKYRTGTWYFPNNFHKFH
ncbi:MAG: hypothetical protein ACI9OJ_003910 [Myxococcota bacterium]|jgi:hypothetical protein